MQRSNLKSLKFRFVIRTQTEHEEAFKVLSKFFWMVDLWRSRVKPAYCIVSEGQCRIGVELSTYWVFRSHPEVSYGVLVNAAKAASDKDGVV